jgi:hypothetical protein
MDRFIAEQNIEHYRRLLAGELGEPKRQCILHLLADEEAKLREIEVRRKQGHTALTEGIRSTKP